MCKAVGLGSCAAKGPKGRKQREETGLRCGRGGVEQGGEGYPRAGDKSLGSWMKDSGGQEPGRLMTEGHWAGVGVGG